MPPDLAAAVERAASQADRSVAAEVRRRLRQADTDTQREADRWNPTPA